MTGTIAVERQRNPRRAGVVFPLFSMRTSTGFGVGEIPDLAAAAHFAQRAGLRVLSLLPTNEILGGETSPYSASSAFALDPVYLGLDACEDFVAAGGRAALPTPERALLDVVAAAPSVDWPSVRRVKDGARARAFAHFRDHEWRTNSPRARDLRRFREKHAAWLPDHALFVALHERFKKPFWDWPAPLAARDPAALLALGADHDAAPFGEAVLEIAWRQWLLDEQWHQARRAAADLGVALMGDLPFMVAGDSSDVWSRPSDFRRDRRVGTPPDAFSADGQDWGLPAFDWDVMAAAGFPWMDARGARAGALFDLWRLDHVIGMYRTFFRSSETEGFSPDDPAAQLSLGESLLRLFARHGQVVAEDLGLLPPFLRPSLDVLQIPGYRVLRWERDDQGIFRDPSTWPALSVATTGTHDVETNAVYWDALSTTERAALVALPALQHLDPTAPFDDRVRDAFLNAVYESPSSLVLIPLQDALGTRDRINVPGTVSADNWTYRPAATLDGLAADAILTGRLRALSRRTARL